MAGDEERQDHTGGDPTTKSQIVERGLLDLSVELSSRDIIAGSDFSLFVLVTNPFTSPVSIDRVHVSLPSELKLAGGESAEQARDRLQKREKQFTETVKMEREKLNNLLVPLLAALDDMKKMIKASIGTVDLDNLQHRLSEVEKSLKLIEAHRTESLINVEGGFIRNVDLQSSSSSTIRVIKGEIRNINIQDPWLVADARSRLQEVELQSSLPKDAELQPGNTAVFTTVIRARNPITISPSKYRLQFSVNYRFFANIDSVKVIHTNTISQEITVRAPVYSLMLGSAIGALFGSIARVLAPVAGTAAAISPTVSVMLSLILGSAAVVFLARKSDAQAFVTIEDIWGGGLIGFLVGYSGTSFFDQLAKISH